MGKAAEFAGRTFRTVAGEFVRRPISTSALALSGGLLIKHVDDMAMRHLEKRRNRKEEQTSQIEDVAAFAGEIALSDQELATQAGQEVYEDCNA